MVPTQNISTLLESHANAGVPASGGDPSPACVPDVVGHKIFTSLLVKVIRNELPLLVFSDIHVSKRTSSGVASNNLVFCTVTV